MGGRCRDETVQAGHEEGPGALPSPRNGAANNGVRSSGGWHAVEWRLTRGRMEAHARPHRMEAPARLRPTVMMLRFSTLRVRKLATICGTRLTTTKRMEIYCQ